jgi:hypothetical protein
MPKCFLQQFQNGFICWNRLRNGCVRAKRKKQWLISPSPFNPPFWSFEKKILLRYFFYITFYFNPKFQLICNQIDLAMENLCLAAILVFSTILFFFAPIYFFYFFLWFLLPKYIIRFTLNLIASGTVFSYNCSPIT